MNNLGNTVPLMNLYEVVTKVRDTKHSYFSKIYENDKPMHESFMQVNSG